NLLTAVVAACQDMHRLADQRFQFWQVAEHCGAGSQVMDSGKIHHDILRRWTRAVGQSCGHRGICIPYALTLGAQRIGSVDCPHTARISRNSGLILPYEGAMAPKMV